MRRQTNNSCKGNAAFLIPIVTVLIFCFCVPFVFAQTPATSGAVASAPKVVSQTPQDPSVQSAPRTASPMDIPKKITVEKSEETIDERLSRKITLDVRDMNVVDVIKFLALKGDFNVVTSKSVTGRASLFLKSVSIKDVLDIVLISNDLAYQVENEIIYVMSGAEYETTYGKKFNDKSKVSIVHLSYAKPSYVLAALDSIKSALGKIIIDEDTGSVVLIDTPQVIAQMKEAIEKMETPMETYIYNLQYAKADVLAEKLRARVDANAVGTILADERSNQLIVRALPGRLQEIEALIQSLDAKTKEVLIDARVIQVVFKPNFDIGIDWDLNFRDSPDKELKKVTVKSVFMDEDGLTSSDNLSSAFTKLAVGDITADAFEASIRALRQVSDTKILSNPKILVTNNEEAKIHVGDTVPYIISTTSGTGDNAITSEDVRFVDVGLKLLVTPTINDDGFVTMRLKPEISTVTEKIESQGGGIPQVNKTMVETTVLVKDVSSIILGSIKKEDKSHFKRGFPWLMDIPFLGRAFSYTTDSITSTEIVIFITPRIVSGAGGYDEYRGTSKPYKAYEGGDDDFGMEIQEPIISTTEKKDE